jgi:UDP-glucose 4-epimerase
MSKIVIFGADGFIGKHLVNALAKTADNDIFAFDRFPDYQIKSEHAFEALNNVTVIPGNFFNRDEVSKVLIDTDYVFHLISTTNPASSNADPFIDVDTNVRASIELFQLCVEHGIKKVIFPSSGGTVYGDIVSDKIDERTAPAPRSPYGIGKLTIEHFLRYFKSTANLNYIVYRIANPYGPGQNIYGKQGVIPIFMHRFLTKEPLSIFGDGSMIRDYIYIDDMVNMMVGSFAKDNRYSEYNLGSGQGYSVNELIEAMEECAGFTIEKRTLVTPPTYVDKSVLNIDRFVDEFTLRPVVSLKDGIARTWKYVKELE